MPKMTREQYTTYRWHLVWLLMAWVVFALAFYMIWQHTGTVVRCILGVIGYVFVPDISIIEGIFTSYETYAAPYEKAANK
ncbi:hypothetical protein N5J06_14060 [Ralstonia sp. CHL-2022]|uniref:Transmembrane protein n=1 Tax=Ralstonia mojiangensis TaxID=2953895 RepID=A0ABT2LBQ6_9RALS|nr:hypothetical protein [Ralstonia mojiangensis]MCT7297744.1 hypothetical protein [Ralstonia mojiangensis]MCT7312084.1 hypothetical protein [Ralstonia mojiangensis]